MKMLNLTCRLMNWDVGGGTTHFTLHHDLHLPRLHNVETVSFLTLCRGGPPADINSDTCREARVDSATLPA